MSEVKVTATRGCQACGREYEPGIHADACPHERVTMCGDCETQGRTGTGPHGETSGSEHCSCWYEGRADGYREGREGAFRAAKGDCAAMHSADGRRIGALSDRLAEIREILGRYLGEPNAVIAAAVRPEIRRWLSRL